MILGKVFLPAKDGKYLHPLIFLLFIIFIIFKILIPKEICHLPHISAETVFNKVTITIH